MSFFKNEFFLIISWKFMEIITFFISLYNDKMVPFFHFITDNYFKNKVLLISEGKELMKFKTLPKFEKFINSSKQDIYYELVLYTDYHLKDEKKNYTVISNHFLNSEIVQEKMTKKSNVNFIIFELEFQKQKYDINLKYDKNFLVENNVFSYAFFKWYLNKNYNVELNEDFTVHYMTNEMLLRTIKWPFILKISENTITSFISSPKKNYN